MCARSAGGDDASARDAPEDSPEGLTMAELIQDGKLLITEEVANR